MSFLIVHHYLIEPKPNLVARATAMLEANFAEVFLQRIVVSKAHQPTSNLPLEQANIAALKQGFLAKTRFDWAWDSPTQFAALLGNSDLTTALFDQWWECTEIEIEFFDHWQSFRQQAEIE
jgi:hypothetical protein